jgi:membrane peptidoglycan carboxypeptidase
MQMTRAYAAFLNGGYLVQPKLIKSGADAPANTAPKRILSQKIADEVVSALETVTEDKGTGMKAALSGYRVAGKTGTAQEVDPATGAYSRSKHIASFIGFAVGVETKIVIFTSLDEPKGIYFASETAAPLFHDVLNAVATRFSIPEQPLLASAKTDKLKLTQAKAVAAPTGAPEVTAAQPASLQWSGTTPAGAMIWKMPALHGLTAREVTEVLAGHTFKLEVHGDGIVRSQVPEEGRPLAEGEVIRLNLGEP